MNTPAHLIFGLAAFGRPGNRAVTGAALLGGLIPDLSLYLLVGVHLGILETPPSLVFNELYFSDAWQAIFRVDNSFILWGMLLVAAIAIRRAWLVALCGAALLHIGLDFPLHHDDGRAHFWPLSTWIFQSPVSYWDPAHHGRIVGAIEIALVCAAGLWLWRRFTGWGMRALIAGLVVIQAVPGIMFALMF